MCEMSDTWLENCITYNDERNMGMSFANMLYQKELDYRKENNISIPEEKEEKNMNTYDYIFWHNPYQELWYAIPRDRYLEFFNGNREKVKGVIVNDNIDKLIQTIKNQ
jgi:hypothetical protein